MGTRLIDIIASYIAKLVSYYVQVIGSQEYATLLFLYRAEAATITTELRQQTAARCNVYTSAFS